MSSETPYYRGGGTTVSRKWAERNEFIGQPANGGGAARAGTILGNVIFGFGTAVAIVAAGLAIYLMAIRFEHINRIQGVGPINNEVFTQVGNGIAITPDPPNHKLTWENTGVLSNIAGDGISVSSATGDVTISNTGVLQVNSRDPTSGNILLSPGDGVAIANGAASNEIEISNTGVLTVNSRVPTSGDIVLNPLAGISIANGGPTNQIDIGNTGVTSNVAGDGITVSGATGDVTVSHTLTTQTGLADTDAMGTQVRYSGVVSGAAQNTWVLSSLSVIGDGQGNVGGTAWQVPATGLYDVRAKCVPPANRTDYEALHLSITFGATTDDPEADGYEAGRTFSRLASEYSPHVSASALIQAGCTSCAVANGAGLKVHAFLENVIYTTTLDLVCAIQVTRLM